MLKSSRLQLISLFVIWLITIFFLVTLNKVDLQIILNNINNGFLDFFFKYCTLLGSGWFALILIAVILVFINIRLSLLLTIANITTGLFVQGLKKIIFEDSFRPAALIKNLHFVQGVDIHLYNSFPSGHTATAFALFFALSLLTQSLLAKWFFFILALLIGYSRIYLSQHFLIDVLVGSIIGTFFFLLTFWLFGSKWEKWNHPLLSSV